MSEKELKNNGQSSTKEMKLDDARRVKVLSPTQLVFKRFFRNKLAITGLVIIVFMFIFSFVGGIVSPYKQSQVFKGTDKIWKEYAVAVKNSELRYTLIGEMDFPTKARAQLVNAINKGETAFSVGDNLYSYTTEGDKFYLIYGNTAVVNVLSSKVGNNYKPIDGFDCSDAFKESFEAAINANETSFTFEGIDYSISRNKKNVTVSVAKPIGIASMLSMNAYDSQQITNVDSYEFRYECEKAINDNKKDFTVAGVRYTLLNEENGGYTVMQGEKEYASVSDIIVSAKASDITLTSSFAKVASDAILKNENQFEYVNEQGVSESFKIEIKQSIYVIKSFQSTELLRSFEAPSPAHWLGLDKNGMDLLTRLMYGGRVSLLVGFIVIFIELFIGVIIGGIAGFFGGHIDNMLMRFIDLFNSIPFMPIMIIFGAVMDAGNMGSYQRVLMMMIILGVMSWTGIARVVRGQILTLREQDFMLATEATGIAIRRRIFKHLVPNVMPLLIVQATMGLGDVILTEATLSFLGLGIKYPLASWGSIINAATDIHVMTNYWYEWIPAGMLILLTVLGFNFVGDGLRDAFDPKMKR